MLMDMGYSELNPYFDFHFTLKEFLYKLTPIIFLISLIKRSSVRLFLLLLIVLFCIFQYAHFGYYGKNITAYEFGMIDGNMGEIAETLANKPSIYTYPLMLGFGGSFLIMVVEVFLSKRISHPKRGYLFALALFVFVELQLLYTLYYKLQKSDEKIQNKDSKLMFPVHDRHSFRNFYVSLNYFSLGILPKYKTLKRKRVSSIKLLSKDSNKTVVLIIGESLRADKFHIGISNLTPRLNGMYKEKSMNGTLFFNTIFSTGTMTKVSVGGLLNDIGDVGAYGQIISESTNLVKLAKKCGYKTAFISNQSEQSLRMIKDLIGINYLDLFLDKDNFKKIVKADGYDDDLIKIINKEPVLHPKSFVVLQQRCAHEPYNVEYPKSFDKKSPYDNCVLFTDYVISSILKSVREKAEGEFFAFFVSDHGELLGEGGRHGHGQLKKEVYQVPFLLYTNSKDKELIDKLKKIKCQKDISDSILYLLGYDVDIDFAKDRNITVLNADFEGFSGYGKVEVKNGVTGELKVVK
jgi:lipid A ethanolaminephosphotransferase